MALVDLAVPMRPRPRRTPALPKRQRLRRVRGACLPPVVPQAAAEVAPRARKKPPAASPEGLAAGGFSFVLALAPGRRCRRRSVRRVRRLLRGSQRRDSRRLRATICATASTAASESPTLFASAAWMSLISVACSFAKAVTFAWRVATLA